MKKVSGIYVGLGTNPVRIGLGFAPRKVRIVQIGTANLVTLDWTREMARSATGAGGIVRAGVGNTPGFALLAIGTGVRPYFGGDVADGSLANQVLAGLVAGYQGTLQGTIRFWTDGSDANRTGNFDVALGSKCGVGSLVEIRGNDQVIYQAAIVALTNHGAAANEVTLDRAVPNGRVIYVGPATDYVAAPAGMVMPAGIEINDTTVANVAATVCSIEAEGGD